MNTGSSQIRKARFHFFCAQKPDVATPLGEELGLLDGSEPDRLHVHIPRSLLQSRGDEGAVADHLAEVLLRVVVDTRRFLVEFRQQLRALLVFLKEWLW